jgi:hypothetical protein
MNTAEFATLTGARPLGRNRFQARCPAHDDFSPSLNFSEGEDGRLLLHCFAGCSVDTILAALNLNRRDLFSGPPLNPAQMAAMRLAHAEREAKGRAKRKARVDAIRRMERLRAVVDALGGQLARAPENDALAKLFHLTCDLLHDAETTVDVHFELMRRDLAQERRVA